MDWDCVRNGFAKTLDGKTLDGKTFNLYGPKIFQHLKFHTPHYNPLFTHELQYAAEMTSLTMTTEINIGKNEMKKMECALYEILETCMKKTIHIP